MDDRYQRELTKLHGAELPDGLWDRVQEGPRLAPLAPGGRSRVTAAVVAFAVFGLAAFFVWKAFTEVAPAPQPAGSNVVIVPPRGETSAVFLADGRPAFVVHHLNGTVSVVDAFSSHRAWGFEELNVWCPSTRQFVEVAHEAHFDEYGTLVKGGPAGWGGVATFTFAVVATDAVGDPAQIQVENIREPTTPGRDSGVGRPPFCPGSDVAPGTENLIPVTGGYTGETGLVVAHSLDGAHIWGSPAAAVAAAPAGWVAVQGTMLVAPDGFVQLCAQVVDGACQGGVAVRGIDGIGLYLNVTRFPDVTGYEEPQVWLVQIRDGVIDNPAGFSGFLDTWPHSASSSGP